MICKVGKKVFWKLWFYLKVHLQRQETCIWFALHGNESVAYLFVRIMKLFWCGRVLKQNFLYFMYFTVDHLHFIFKYFSLKISSHNNFVSKLHDNERCRGRWYDWRSLDFALGYFTSKIRSQQHKSFEKIITPNPAPK